MWMITMRIRKREEDQKEVLRDKTRQDRKKAWEGNGGQRSTMGWDMETGSETGYLIVVPRY